MHGIMSSFYRASMDNSTDEEEEEEEENRKKRVTFNLPPAYLLIDDDDECRSARVDVFARDKLHFMQKLVNIEKAISFIFQADHRNRIFKKIFVVDETDRLKLF